MVSDIARAAAVASAVGSGVALGEGEEERLTANTDDKITIYSMMDGSPREVAKIDAQRVLMKKLPGGGPAFWAPGLPGSAPEYTKGALKCYLDPEFDETAGPAGVDREWIDAIGLAGRTCNMMAPDKHNQKFSSVYQREEHMAKKHRNEWKTIQGAIETKRREDEATERRLYNEAILALAQSTAKPKEK